MADIVCVSDCCCDVIFGGLARIPSLGTEEYGQELAVRAGGGANTPMGLARLGCSTAYLSAVGSDVFGGVVGRELEQWGVLPDLLQTAPHARTWVSAVLSTKEDRSFASFAGTSVQWDRDALVPVLKQARHLHTYLYYAARFPDLLPLCRSLGVTVSLDATWEEGQSLSQIAPFLRQADLFLPNHREAMELTGAETPEAALKVLGGICPAAVVTLGDQGSIALAGGTAWRASAASAGPFVDANGAGDLFNAGLLCARLENQSLPDQLRMASASGAVAVSYFGGMDAAYTRTRVEQTAKTVSVVQFDL